MRAGRWVIAALGTAALVASVGVAVVKSDDPSSSDASSGTPRCHAAWVRLSDAGAAGVSAGTLASSLRFSVTRRCWLRGEPSVRLLGGDGALLGTAHGRPDTKRDERYTASPARPGYSLYYHHQPDTADPPCTDRAVIVEARLAGTLDWISTELSDGGFDVCRNDVSGVSPVGAEAEYGPLGR